MGVSRDYLPISRPKIMLYNVLISRERLAAELALSTAKLVSVELVKLNGVTTPQRFDEVMYSTVDPEVA